RFRQVEESLTALAEAGLQRATVELDHVRSRLRLLTPSAQIEQGYLRLDDMSNRLSAALRHSTQESRRRLVDVRNTLLQRSPERRIEIASHQLLSLWKRLQAASPQSVLNRGFAIVRDESGKPVIRRAAVKPGQRLKTEFADGSVDVKAE